MIAVSRTIERHIRFGGSGAGVKEGPTPDSVDVPKGRVPHIAKLMALAIRLDELVRSGTITTFAELARLGQVSRARITQILNLVNLAPDIQEAILFLPRTERGRAGVILRDLQPIAAVTKWAETTPDLGRFSTVLGRLRDKRGQNGTSGLTFLIIGGWAAAG